jgi:putative spermidine/putrescine transport system substrate-binding protein
MRFKDFPATRRSVLKGMTGAAVAAGAIALGSRRSLADSPLKGTGTVIAYDGGGAWGAAQKAAYYEPFEKETGIKVIAAPQAPTGKIKASILAGAPAYDVCDLSGGSLASFIKEDLLQKIDYQYFAPGDKEAYSPVPCGDYAIPALLFSMLIAYDKSALGGSEPKTWADAWDTAKFPGKRTLSDVGQDAVGSCTYEIALLADGVPPDQLYPLDFDRALKSLSKLKPSILKFWAAGAEPVQLLLDKHVAVASAWNGRLAAIQEQNAPVGYTWNQGILQWDAWVVLKGAANAENAMKLLAFAARPEQQAKFAELITYGPTNSRAYEHLSAERAALLPTAPAQAKSQIVQNYEWWNADSGDGTTNEQKATKLWQQWITQG